ncbi:TPA: hypothetical protein N0F65_002015 [Lagenidium giganteum]|uniref:Uncharacterized protein n=1 Tax=Lagenidium giganteum TaxID=4803 RepID=A0AAV2Z3G7_9STRA|nr:TPA: hypothetical protein N0F65_002015 [Lagenidium giganteum]
MEAIAAQVQALKSEGNAQFQQKSFMGAAQKYTAALALLEEFAGDAESLRTPLLLNRAWANLETRDVNLALQAEDDCSQVLLTQSMCVKALYRRALARELLGNIQVSASTRLLGDH